MLTRALALSAVVSIAAAQVSLSSSCTSALTSIVTNVDASACLVPSPLIAILTSPNASIVAPVNNWLTGLCAAPVCSNDTLSAIVVNATAGCSTELASFGLSSSDNTAVTALLQQYYPTARNALCLKDGSTNCITQILTNVQEITGTISLSNAVSLASASTDNATLPANVACTDCVKAIYNTVNTAIPGLFNSDSVQETCGASFVDGTTPAGITEAASNSTQSTTSTKDSGAAHISSLGALSGMSVIAFLVLLA